MEKKLGKVCFGGFVYNLDNPDDWIKYAKICREFDTVDSSRLTGNPYEGEYPHQRPLKEDEKENTRMVGIK